MATDYQKQRMARLGVTAGPTTVPSPQSAMDKIKAFISPQSTAGLLRDQDKRTAEAIKKAGG